MKKLLCVRHGQAVANVAKVFGGHSDAKLTSLGEYQAKQAGKAAKITLPVIDVIICSPLRRAYCTAELIAKELEYPTTKIEQNPLFIERSYGILEGTSAKDFFNSHDPQELDNIQGVETEEHLRQRAIKALSYIKLRREDNILIVSHGAFENAFICTIKELPYSYTDLANEPKNAEIVEIM